MTRVTAAAFALAVTGVGSAAADCATQMPGAREGRPPNAAEIMSSWPWSEPTCWFQWRERGATKQRREQMRAECLVGAGRDYLHFQEDFGAIAGGSNTCIFRLAGAGGAEPPRVAPTSRPAPPPPSRPAGSVEPNPGRLAEIASIVQRADAAVRSGRPREAVPLYVQAVEAYRTLCCYGDLTGPFVRPGGEAVARLALDARRREFDAACRADIDELRSDPRLAEHAVRNFGVVGERCARHPALAKLREFARRLQPSPPQRTTSRESARPGKCPDGNDARRCVTLEQRGRNGRWHMFRLINACNRTFKVNVFHCDMEWAGGCRVERIQVSACETTGSASEGKQSWDREAELRW